MHRLLLTIVAASAIVLGCSSTSAPTPSASGPIDLAGDWQMASGSVDGAPFPVPPGAQITLTVQGTTIGGRAACNHYGGDLAVDADGAPHFDITSMTEMACEEPIMAAESAFLAAMPRVRSVARDGDRLSLTGQGVELLFDRLAPPPVADMVGTEWVLESLVDGDAVSSVAGDRATLRFDAGGTVRGGTGCRTFSGKWIEANGGITLPEWGMDQAECEPALQPQDSHVVGVLEGFRVAIDGQTMTLTGDGEGLIYRAAGS
jgi:heat shock protein HslJ